MAKTKQQKKEELLYLTEKLKEIKSAVFCDYTGLNVAGAEELRKSLREEKVDYRVAKKTILTRALKEAKIAEFEVKGLVGQLAIAFGSKDEIIAPKLIAKFRKSHESIKILGGIYENKFITTEEVEKMAQIPSREELLARLLGSINAPISGIVGVMSGVIRNFVGAIQAIKESKS